MGRIPWGLALLALALLACASPPGSRDGLAPLAIEYRLASFSRTPVPLSLGGLASSACVSEKETETLEYVYPSGRRVSADVSTEPGFRLSIWQGEVNLHEMPLADGLQVAALADLKIDERRMKKARKFKAKHAGCDLMVFVEGAPADLLMGAEPWGEVLPAGRFPTLDLARQIYQRPGIAITIVPEALEVTRWRREFRRWQALRVRWSFRCAPSFRAALKKKHPESHARLEAEDPFVAGLSCSERVAPPRRPVP